MERSHHRTAIAPLAAATVILAAACGSTARHVRATDAGDAASSTTTAAHPCPAASMVVQGVTGERLHPDVLPAGFALRNGDENELGQLGMLEYTRPSSTGNAPRIELLRYRTTMRLDELTASGPGHPVTVQGKQGVATDSGERGPLPGPSSSALVFRTVAWWDHPGTALVVSGANLDAATVLDVANHVHYDAGTVFEYPSRPTATVTATEAQARSPHQDARPTAKLTSFGELAKLLRPPNLTRPPVDAVWMVATPNAGADPTTDEVIAVDAVSGASIFTIDAAPADAVAAITDRATSTTSGTHAGNDGSCNPPFGVMTRAEVSFWAHPRPDATVSLELVTQGAFSATTTGRQLTQCETNTCAAGVPLWIQVQAAPDHSLGPTEGIGRLPPLPGATTTAPVPDGSWSVLAIDARTGAQDPALSSGGVSGVGSPPADVLALTDLAPG